MLPVVESLFDNSNTLPFISQKKTSFILREFHESMEAKSSPQSCHFRRFPNPMFANCVHATSASLLSLLNVKFFKPNCWKFAVECKRIVGFLETFEMLVFFRQKIDEIFKKNEFLRTTLKVVGKFAVKCLSNSSFSNKCHFRPNYEVF